MNNLIIKEFEKLIIYYKLEHSITHDNVIQYKINVAENLIDVIKHLKYEINENNIDKLKNYDGVSTKTIEKVKHILSYGYINIPTKHLDVLEMYNILNRSGISDSMLFDLIKKYKVKHIDDIKNLVSTGKIKLPVMTQKYLKYSNVISLKLSHNFIKDFEDYLNEKLKYKFIIAGSFRRNNKFSRDVDILIYNNKYSLQYILENINDIIIEDLTTLTNVSIKYMCFIKFKNTIFKCDFRIFNTKSYYTSLFYFTGPKIKNIDVRKRFKKLGYKLNEFELIDNNDKHINLKSENDIYKILNKLEKQ